MKLRYLSDLHLEFIKPNKIENFLRNIPSGGSNEICICAGDIGNPTHSNNHYDTFMTFMSKNFKKTFVIAGNHEYYHQTKTIDETNAFLHDYFRKFDNITFLDNSCEIYENRCFVGTTLWSKITNPIYEINDVFNIPNFDFKKYNQLNKTSIDFLENALSNNENCIVITHHMPSQSLIDIKYKTPKMLPYNQWFYCDLDSLIETKKDKIECWIYGHTHTQSSKTIHGIPFLCNPNGYPNENQSVDFSKCVELVLK